MINEKTVNEICMKRHMLKLSVSTNPTWVTKQRDEGIELKGSLEDGNPIPFWVKDGNRIYDQPASEAVQKTLDLIKVEEIEIPQEPKKPETVITTEGADLNDSTVILLPERFTETLLAKWRTLTGFQRLLMVQKTPPDKIKQVKVSNTETAPYVEGNYMIKEANFVFLFDWKFVKISENIGTVGVSVSGYFVANLDGKEYSRPATGYETINAKMTAQLAIKSATTDAIKKGLSMFGFNSDVYSGEV